MAKKIIWAPSAIEDFSKILAYLNEKWNFKIANEFSQTTFSLIQNISTNPKVFPIIHKEKKIRKCVLSKQNTLFTGNMSQKLIF
jgi:plasmid stabilization system protein ParE